MAKNDTDKRLVAIGNHVKKLREDAGYTAAEGFAYDKGVARVQYWRLESGANMQMGTFLKLCDAHEITPQEFFTGLNLS